MTGENSNRVKTVLNGVFNGNVFSTMMMRRFYPLFIVLLVLAMVYIGLMYKHNSQLTNYRVLEREKSDYRNEYLSLSSRLTQMKRGSVVGDSVRARYPELIQPHTPSYQIDGNKK